MRSSLFMAALGILALAFAGLALASHGAASADTSIETGNYYFCTSADQGQVCETDITAGDTVTWSVEAGTHDISQCADATFPSSCTAGFDSGSKGSGSTYSQTFNTAGTIYYHCEFHPTEMKGKIVVAAAAAAATATTTPSPSAAPTAAATSTATPTSAALPKTGGTTGDGGSSAWVYAVLALGIGLLSGSAATLAVARKRS